MMKIRAPTPTPALQTPNPEPRPKFALLLLLGTPAGHNGNFGAAICAWQSTRRLTAGEAIAT